MAGRYIDNEPWMTFEMLKTSGRDGVGGKCAKCGEMVYESLCVLDDGYGVYRGKCPFCGAINLLSTTFRIRGYDSKEAQWVLPKKHEIELNKWPESPTQD